MYPQLTHYIYNRDDILKSFTLERFKKKLALFWCGCFSEDFITYISSPRLIEDPGQGIGAGLIFRRVRVMEAGWDEEVVVDHGSI